MHQMLNSRAVLRDSFIPSDIPFLCFSLSPYSACMQKGQTLKHDDRDETDWPFVTRSTAASEYLQQHLAAVPLFPRFLHICVGSRRKIRTNCRAGEVFLPGCDLDPGSWKSGKRVAGERHLMRAVLSESSSSRRLLMSLPSN